MSESAHFKNDELTCHCGCGRQNASPVLLRKLEQARTLIGNAPMVLTSACRCPAYELEVSGKSGGAHVEGTAADIYCTSDVDRFRLIGIFKELGIQRFGVASTFLHVDVSPTLPNHVMWVYS